MLARTFDDTDPLSDILQIADLETAVTAEFRATNPWSLSFPPPTGLKFLAVVDGNLYARTSTGNAMHLESGDVLLMNHSQPYVLSSEPNHPPEDGKAMFRDLDPFHKTLVIGAGKDVAVIGGHIQVNRALGLPLTQLLPDQLHIRASHGDATVMQWLMSQLMNERRTRGHGHRAITSNLAQLMFLQILRVHVANHAAVGIGWLRLLGDAKLLPAIKLMHLEPGKSWQMDELAAATAMSRTSFAVRFKQVSGLTPMSYLAQWRMLLAQHALLNDARPMSSWVGDLGYASESAFSHAFKRIIGVTPTQYRNDRDQERRLSQ